MEENRLIGNLLERARRAVWESKWRAAIDAICADLDLKLSPYIKELDPEDEPEE
jgi:hypothetical protein